jgi:hypothetical protein
MAEADYCRSLLCSFGTYRRQMTYALIEFLFNRDGFVRIRRNSGTQLPSWRATRSDNPNPTEPIMSGGTTGTLPGAATRTPAGGLGANRFGAVIGVHLSTQLIKEDLRRAQIGRRKAFAEAIVYAREEIACLGCPPLGLP